MELKEIEDAMRAHDDPFLTAPELAEVLDVSDTHVRDHLRLLERTGAVVSKQLGARTLAWWHVDRVTRPHVAPEDHPDQAALDDPPAADGAHSAETAPAPASTEVPEDIESIVDSLEIPGRAEKWTDRKEAVGAMLRHLRDGGDSKSSDLYEPVYDHESTHYKSAENYWKNLGQPVMQELRERGVVELVDEQKGIWSWAGGRP